MIPLHRRPPGRARARRVALLAAALVVSASIVAVAAPPLVERLDGPSQVAETAQRLPGPGDVVSVYNVGQLQPEVAAAAYDAARAAGATAAPVRGVTIGMVRLLRGGQVVQQPPPGYRIPMTVTAMPAGAILGTMGADVSAALDAGSVVMGGRTASLRGARASDVIEVVAADGSVRSMRVGLVAPDDQVGGTELVMTTEAADRLGIVAETRVAIWGVRSRAAIDAALAAEGLVGRRETRIIRSWDPPNPDGTLSSAETKELLGEFAIQLTSGEALVQEAAWQSANLPPGRELLSSRIPIRARCHLELVDDLRAALDEVAAAGLAGAIDVANANTYGGCHYPRFNRINGDLGSLSRHSWGMALDTNTVSNCQGCVPRMDCRVVQIFRKHNFAWGGNFLRPDGMHFEWVGERRDLIATPTRYCPNVGVTGTESVAAGDSRAELFAEDNLAEHHDHDHG